MLHLWRRHQVPMQLPCKDVQGAHSIVLWAMSVGGIACCVAQRYRCELRSKQKPRPLPCPRVATSVHCGTEVLNPRLRAHIVMHMHRNTVAICFALSASTIALVLPRVCEGHGISHDVRPPCVGRQNTRVYTVVHTLRERAMWEVRPMRVSSVQLQLRKFLKCADRDAQHVVGNRKYRAQKLHLGSSNPSASPKSRM